MIAFKLLPGWYGFQHTVLPLISTNAPNSLVDLCTGRARRGGLGGGHHVDVRHVHFPDDLRFCEAELLAQAQHGVPRHLHRRLRGQRPLPHGRCFRIVCVEINQ